METAKNSVGDNTIINLPFSWAQFVLSSRKNLKQLSPNKVIKANNFNSGFLEGVEKGIQIKEPIRVQDCALALHLMEKAVW